MNKIHSVMFNLTQNSTANSVLYEIKYFRYHLLNKIVSIRLDFHRHKKK